MSTSERALLRVGVWSIFLGIPSKALREGLGVAGPLCMHCMDATLCSYSFEGRLQARLSSHNSTHKMDSCRATLLCFVRQTNSITKLGVVRAYNEIFLSKSISISSWTYSNVLFI